MPGVAPANQGGISLPAGFVLESQSQSAPQKQQSINLPPGFELESAAPSQQSQASQQSQESQPQQSDRGFLEGVYDNTIGPLVSMGRQLADYYQQKSITEKAIDDAGGPLSLIADAVTDPSHPLNKLGRGFVLAAATEAKTAYALTKDSAKAEVAAMRALVRGNFNEAQMMGQQAQSEGTQAIGHGLAAIVPGIGPAAAKAGEDIGNGNAAYGSGEATGLLGSMLAPELLSNGIGKLGGAVAASDVEKLAAATNPKSARFVDAAERALPELKRVANGEPSSFDMGAPASDEAASVESPYSPAVTTQDDIGSAIAARNAQRQLGSAAATIPGRILGQSNRLVDEVGTTAATIPDSVLGPKLREFTQAADDAIEPMQTIAKGLSSPRDLAGVIQLTKAANEQLEGIFQSVLKPVADTTIDATPIADAMENSISRYIEQKYPDVADKIREDAAFYRGKEISIGDLDEFRRGVNGELDSYYIKNNLKRSDALKDPSIAYRVAEADAIRDAEYSAIQDATGRNMRDLKKLQSDVTEIQRAAQANFERLKLKNAMVRGQSATKKFWDAAEHTVSSHPLAGIRQFAKVVFGRGARQFENANKAARGAFRTPSRFGPTLSGAANATGNTAAVLSGANEDQE